MGFPIKSYRSGEGGEVASWESGTLDFYEERYTRYGESALHSHEETELILLLEGIVEDVRKKQAIRRTSTTLLLLPAGEPHAPRVHSGVRLFQVRIKPQWLARFPSCSSLVETPQATCQGRPLWLAQKLYAEFQNLDDLSPLMLEGLTLELLVETARSGRNTGEAITRPIPNWLKRARDFLHDTFRENPSLETIATVAGVHPAHLTRGFRQHYRCTPGDYVRQLRVEHASHLLTTSATPLAQIALEAGFAHQSHFCRAFKSRTGMTPTEYQKAARPAGLRQ